MRWLKFPLMAATLMATYLGLEIVFRHLSLTPSPYLTLAFFLCAVMSDYATTVKATELGGKEGNPFAGFLFSIFGVREGGMLVVMFVAIVAILIWKTTLPYQQLAFACAYWLVPINNLLVIQRLESRGNKK
jgi:hypothetical protein